MKFIVALAILCVCNSLAFSQKVSIKTKPNWVKKYEANLAWSNEDDRISGGFYYLLLDYQDNIQLQASYSQRAIKILNNEGIQEKSDISITYDPDYQKLVFHEVSVYRDGQVINKLADHEIRTLQRERGHERYLYDGRLDAVINLRDIRVDDVIIYSYSRIGYNPAYDGHRASFMEFAYRSPVLEIKNRLISREDRPISFKYNHGIIEGTVNEIRGGNEYIWEKSNNEAVIYDKNVPRWYDPYMEISYSDYGSWGEIIDDLVPLYKLTDKQQEDLRVKLNDVIKAENQDSIAAQAIRFVQDEVRYLGFEDGINAFKPHNPLQVLSQRFGDCKDKSFLLCAILLSYGIDANPVLVNTSLTDHLNEELPGFGAFDHCVAQINLNNNVFYIDPTINYQGGLLSSTTFPDYGLGLVVNTKSTALTALPKPNERGRKIYQQFVVQNEKDSVAIKIKTISYDSEADRNRSYFANTDISQISKNYLNFYSAEYPNIKSVRPITFTDNRIENEFIIEEEYTVSNFGKQSSEINSIVEFDFYALDFENHLYVPKSPSRTMPYASPNSTDYFYEMRIDMPKEPTGYVGKKKFESDDYSYRYESKIRGNEIIITHQYTTKSKSIPTERIQAYLEAHSKMTNYLSYRASYDIKQRLKFAFNGWLALILIILLVLGAFLSKKLYRSFDLQPRFALRRNKPLGGFLVVIAIALILKPLIWLLTLFENGKYFNANMWSLLQNAEDLAYIDTVKTLLALDMVYDVFEFTFVIMLIIVLFKKRTVFPRLATIYMMINMGYIIVSGLLMEHFGAERFDIAPSAEAVIWTSIISFVFIVYLKKSNRVEQTFIHVLNGSNNK